MYVIWTQLPCNADYLPFLHSSGLLFRQPGRPVYIAPTTYFGDDDT
jgi:hypothetical protein